MAQINKPSDYFNTILYTGDGAASKSLTGVGFQPDAVWIKSRSNADNHNFFDSVRGTGKFLRTNNGDVEQTGSNNLLSFDNDGFTVGTHTPINRSSGTHVAWNWLAGGTASSNTDGTITSSVSANTTAGFSIVSYTGSGTTSDTVGHGLGTTPNVVICKNRSTTGYGWNVHHSSLDSGYNLQLQSTSAQFNSTGNGHLGTVGSSTFGFVAGTSGNYQTVQSGETYIAYCFAEKKGYSKFGSYTGNGNADGTFTYTGFKPAFVIIKRTDAVANWCMFDNKRDGFNVNNDQLLANDDSAGSDGQTNNFLDILSNGFKCRNTATDKNANGGTYIYMAFAEQPLVGTNNIPCTAR